MDTVQKNFILPQVLSEWVEKERERGVMHNQTARAALYWYMHRLTSAQREIARIECQAWIESGVLPDAAMSDAVDAVLREDSASQERSPAQSERGAGKT